MRYMSFKEFVKSLRKWHSDYKLYCRFNKVLMNGLQYGLLHDVSYKNNEEMHAVYTHALSMITEQYSSIYALYLEMVLFHEYTKNEEHRYEYESIYTYLTNYIKDSDGNQIIFIPHGNRISLIYMDKEQDRNTILAIIKIDPKINDLPRITRQNRIDILKEMLESVKLDDGSVLVGRNFGEKEFIEAGKHYKDELKYSMYWYFSHADLDIEDYEHDIYIIDRYNFRNGFILYAFAKIKEDIKIMMLTFYIDENGNEQFLVNLCKSMDEIGETVYSSDVSDSFKSIVILSAMIIRVYTKIHCAPFLYKFLIEESLDCEHLISGVNQ